MRISDWSSDVCSSDLSGGLSGLMLITAIVLARLLGPAEFGVAALALGIVQLLNLVVEMLFHDAIVQRKQDRKSVVEGQRVSVRVDLGGRRIIKNTNKHITTELNMHSLMTKQKK